MNGKVVLITGATNGIGKVAAQELAAKGATVVLVSRSQARLDETVTEIKQATGNQQVSAIQADLSLMSEVEKTAQTFLGRFSRLDVLLNNAGAMFEKRQITAEGLEMTFALNHMSYFYLTELLLDTLKATAKQVGEARIVNVSSDAHQIGRINFDDLERNQSYGFNVYGESKLMNILFTYKLADRLEGTGVTANTVHPGFVKTGFGRNNSWIFSNAISLVQNLIAISPEKGAETLVYLASSAAVKGQSGKYFVKNKAQQTVALSYDKATQARLWERSENMLNALRLVTV